MKMILLKDYISLVLEEAKGTEIEIDIGVTIIETSGGISLWADGDSKNRIKFKVNSLK